MAVRLKAAGLGVDKMADARASGRWEGCWPSAFYVLPNREGGEVKMSV